MSWSSKMRCKVDEVDEVGEVNEVGYLESVSASGKESDS